MQGLQGNIAEPHKTTEPSLQRVQRQLAELQCHSCRGNLKFYGIKEREHRAKTQDLLRKFLRTDLKIPKEDEESIQLDRVQKVSAGRVSSGTPNSKPRPIIIKFSSFHDKEFIKSFIKNLTKGRNLGISDDFPEKAVPSTKSRQARKAYCIFQGRKANYRWVALPRPRDNCFPSLRTFNGRIN